MFCVECKHKQNQVVPKRRRNRLSFVCVGLQGSGKTSILEYLTSQSFCEDVHPTYGFNLRVFKFEKTKLITVYDCGGMECFRHLWEFYYTGTNGIIFVIDSLDEKSLEESGHELISLLNNQSLQKKPILIYANKSEQENSMSIEALGNYLSLTELND